MQVLSAFTAMVILLAPFNLADAASVKSVDAHGRILVDDKGMTLYTFDKTRRAFRAAHGFAH